MMYLKTPVWITTLALILGAMFPGPGLAVPDPETATGIPPLVATAAPIEAEEPLGDEAVEPEEPAKPELDLVKESQGFELIETEADYWFWNKEMVKRWRKEEGGMTYYWVDIHWRELWRVGNRFFIDGTELSPIEFSDIFEKPVFTKTIHFDGPPTLNHKVAVEHPPFAKNDSAIEKDGERYGFQERGKYFPKYATISQVAYDPFAETVWVALEPILQRSKRSVTTAQGGHIVEYEISAGPPYQGFFFEIHTRDDSQYQHSPDTGVPLFQEYEDGKPIIEHEALEPVIVRSIAVTENEIEIFTRWHQKVAVFDKIRRVWNRP